MPIRELCLHVIRRCNWFCDHCYYGSAPSDTVAERTALLDPVHRPSVKSMMSLDLATQIIGQCRNAGVRRVTVQGGEPFLHPQLRQIVETARSEGLLTAIPTNGNLIGSRELEWIERSLNLIFVSIHGLEQYHDAFVHSKGAFKRSLNAALECSKIGVQTGVLSSVCRANQDSVLELSQLLDESGIPMHGIFYQTEAGRGTHTEAMTIEEWEQFLNRARRLRSQLKRTRIRLEVTRVPMDSVQLSAQPLRPEGAANFPILDCAPTPQLEHKNGHSCVTCLGVEKHICFCNTEGDLYNCSLLMDQKEFMYASVAGGATLRDYFGGISWDWAYAKAPLDKECKACELLDICHGGCMAARTGHNRNLHGLALCADKTMLPTCVLYPDYDVYKAYVAERAE